MPATPAVNCKFERKGRPCPCPHLHSALGAANAYNHDHWGNNPYVPACGHPQCADRPRCVTPGAMPDLTIPARFGMAVQIPLPL